MWNSPQSTCLRVGVWCQCTGFEFWDPILRNNQSKANLWVLDTASFVVFENIQLIHRACAGAPSFDCPLHHGFIVLKEKKHGTKLRGSHVRRNVINITQIKIGVLGWISVFHVECCVPRQVSRWPMIFGMVDLVRWRMKYFNHQVLKIKSGNYIHAYNTYNRAPRWEELAFEGMKSTLSKLLITPWDCFRFWIVWRVERTSRLFINKSLRSLLLWFVFPRTATIRSHSSSAGIPSNLNPASREINLGSVQLCETKSLFLAHPICWHKRVTSDNAQNFLLMLIWGLQGLLQNQSLETTQAALLCCVSHITTLLVFTCMMNVRDQTRQSVWHKILSIL